MAQWQVIADRVEIFPHPNANGLDLAKVGPFQLVVAKSNGYKDSDIVVFAPERSILPDDLKGHYVNSETGIPYLVGPECNRVKRIRLRGEYSDGVTIDPAWVEERLGVSVSVLPLREDLSERLGIVKYEPPIPMDMQAALTPFDAQHIYEHDVEHFRLYATELTDGEAVIVTEKIHGSQLVLYRRNDGAVYISSKGFAHRGQVLLEDERNFYWRAIRTGAILDLLDGLTAFAGCNIQLFGEALPCQGGFSYGQSVPTVRFFRMIVDGRELAYAEVPDPVKALWVPVVYQGPYALEALVPLATGPELVSGKGLHIREGVVIAPAIARRSSEGFALYLKVINPKFKDSEEFVS